MSRMSAVAWGGLLAASLCLGQTAAQTPTQAAGPNAVGHGAFPVKVVKTLDSSKLKEGDTVEFETAGSFKLPDGTLVPKGSKLTGHITTATARSKGEAQSQLTVAFDKLNVANGKQLTVKGVVQAVFPPAEEVDPGVPGSSAHQGSSAVAPTPPSPDYHPTTDIKVGSNTDSRGSQPAADPKSVGVHGFDNLDLEDGSLRSKGKNVKLGGGVRLIVYVDILE
jgi:hypothetical protein